MCVIEKGLFKKLLLITVKSPRDAIESKVPAQGESPEKIFAQNS